MRQATDEHGAVAVLVTLSLFMLLGVAMLAVDAGNLWQERRNLINGTDATALAVAQEAQRESLPAGDCGGVATASEYLGSNTGEQTELVRCEIVYTGNTTGYVVIEARKPAQLFFASVFGFEDQGVTSMTAAQFGGSAVPDGLRPFALCEQTVLDSGQTIRQHLEAATEPGSFVLRWDKDNPNACTEDSPGNWGYLDIDCSTNDTSGLRRHLSDGYYDAPACWREDGDTWWIPAYDGGTQGVRGTLEGLRGEVFPLVLYDAYSRPPRKEFKVSGFLGVRLIDFCAAPQCSNQEDRWFEFEFQDVYSPGQWIDGGTATNVMQVRICDVDRHPDGTDTAGRCA